MTDFNLEQFKAGRIAVNNNGISGRYLGDLKDTDGNSITLMSVALSHPEKNRGHEWTHCFTPYGRSVNNSEEPFTKMKPEKKRLYIRICNNTCFKGGDFHAIDPYGYLKPSAKSISEGWQEVEVEIEV